MRASSQLTTTQCSRVNATSAKRFDHVLLGVVDETCTWLSRLPSRPVPRNYFLVTSATYLCQLPNILCLLETSIATLCTYPRLISLSCVHSRHPLPYLSYTRYISLDDCELWLRLVPTRSKKTQILLRQPVHRGTTPSAHSYGHVYTRSGMNSRSCPDLEDLKESAKEKAWRITTHNCKSSWHSWTQSLQMETSLGKDMIRGGR